MTRTRGGPRKPCRVCRLPTSELELVEGGILAGWSSRRISERFTKLTRRHITRHMECIAKRASEEEEG